MSYHKTTITRGVLGEISKIQEELDELKDASQQGCRVLELCELADMIGAIKLYLEKYHKTIKLSDLDTMADLTASAFKDGTRC